MKTQLIQSLLKLLGVVFLLSLELLESKSISLHLLRVIKSSSLHFNGMRLLHLINLILVGPLHIFLVVQKFIISLIIFNGLVFDFCLEFTDFLVLAIKLLLDLSLIVLFGNVYLVLEMLNISLEFILLLFFDEIDLVRLSNLTELLILFAWIFV